MPNPSANVTTTTEVGYCPFCQRTRNLRREERQLGGLVRTTIDCETCHRTLSSAIGPPAPAQPKPEPVRKPEPEPERVVETAPKPRKAAAKKAPAKKTATKAPASKAPAKKTATKKK